MEVLLGSGPPVDMGPFLYTATPNLQLGLPQDKGAEENHLFSVALKYLLILFFFLPFKKKFKYS